MTKLGGTLFSLAILGGAAAVVVGLYVHAGVPLRLEMGRAIGDVVDVRFGPPGPLEIVKKVRITSMDGTAYEGIILAEGRKTPFFSEDILRNTLSFT